MKNFKQKDIELQEVKDRKLLLLMQRGRKPGKTSTEQVLKYLGKPTF